jgi:thiamine-phosphate pyrophosphorylase
VILHLVTDRRRLAPAATDPAALGRCLLMQVDFAVRAGIDLVQVRERDLEARDLARLVTGCVELTRRSRTRVIVNDRLDVALACGADGVHLRGDSLPASAVRALVPAGFLIGRSVHHRAEAVEQAPHVDYLIAGTVWATSSKPAGGALLGLDGLRTIVRAVDVPVLAIGGITIDRMSDVAAAGAAGIAAIALFQPGSDAACRAAALEATGAEARRRFDRPEPGS